MSTDPTGADRSFTLVVNPVAGTGAGAGRAVAAARLLRDAGAQVETAYPTDPGRGTADVVTAAAERGDVVVAVGGDGMVSLLAGPVADAGLAFGLLPAGRGNDLARMLDLDGSLAAQVAGLLEAPERALDLLAVGGRPGDGGEHAVAGSVYVGVDAHAAATVTRMRRTPVRLQYPVAAVTALAAYRPARIRVTVDGEATLHTAATCVLANSGYYGGGMHIAPGAAVDDGLLDVVIVEAASRLSLIRSLPKLYAGTHVDQPEVHVRRGREARIELLDGGLPRVEVGADGEPLAPLTTSAPVTARVRAGALRFIGA